MWAQSSARGAEETGPCLAGAACSEVDGKVQILPAGAGELPVRGLEQGPDHGEGEAGEGAETRGHLGLVRTRGTVGCGSGSGMAGPEAGKMIPDPRMGIQAAFHGIRRWRDQAGPAGGCS